MSPFWVSLHHLYIDYMSEGLTSDERAKAIICAFMAMPPIARRELIADLLPLAQHLPDMYAMAMAAQHKLEHGQATRRGGEPRAFSRPPAS